MIHPHVNPPNIGKCQLLGPVSIIVQSIMGILIILVLLLKRTYEIPKRRLSIWLYDIIKQLGGSFVIHLLNIMLSIWKQNNNYNNPKILLCNISINVSNENNYDDECDWYFVNLLMDTTLGIPILYCILHGLERLGSLCHISNIKSGDYFDNNEEEEEEEEVEAEENNHRNQQHLECGLNKSRSLSSPSHYLRRRNPKFKAFLKQFILFLIGLIMMKFIIYMILTFMEPLAYLIANLVIGWCDPWPNFQVFLVMFICPVLLNCFQYCCIDNIIKLHNNNVTQANLDSFEASIEEQERQEEQESFESQNISQLNIVNYGSIKTTLSGSREELSLKG
ncbi:uncharacterized protein PWA37_000199 [Arxiozyma heterogenica]|uniref:uncharacterized protein n=1 Tax=Arxiozyma heterogenica TaxID=278026 RepID=UPI002EEC5332